MSVAMLLVACLAPPANTTSGVFLGGAHWYQRIVQIQHGSHRGDLLAMADGSGGAFWRSSDDGRTFDNVGVYPNPAGAWSTIFEMPRTVGSTVEGTILWATAVTGPSGRTKMRVEVWASTDAGETWSYLSDCVDPDDTPDATSGGIYEPNLHLTDDDRLVCVYSAETHQPRHSQTLDQTISTDGGHTWGSPTSVVAVDAFWDRPGMGTVVRLPSGRWLMAYELCGFPTISCQAHLRTSNDGTDWGDPAFPGRPIVAPDGALPSHAPVLTWSPDGGSSGTLRLTSQEFSALGLARTGRSGNSMLVSTDGGSTWSYRAQPVSVDFSKTPIPAGEYDWCSNYSTPVLGLGDGRVVQLNSAGNNGSCQVVVASGH